MQNDHNGFLAILASLIILHVDETEFYDVLDNMQDLYFINFVFCFHVPNGEWGLGEDLKTW